MDGWQAALGGDKGFVLVTASLASVAQRAPSSRWPLKQPSSEYTGLEYLDLCNYPLEWLSCGYLHKYIIYIGVPGMGRIGSLYYIV